MRNFLLRARARAHAGAAVVLGGLALTACAPSAVIGTRYCEASPGPEAGFAPDPTVPISLSWSTGFEDGFCSYAPPSGYCYTAQAGTYSVVTSPVHSGRYAAAFLVQSDAAGSSQSQARCIVQGALPTTAYYGAWYYVPAHAQVNDGGLWNLFHFTAGLPEAGLPRPIWDVQLITPDDAGMRTQLYGFPPTGGTPEAGVVPPIPVAQWFHIEVYYKHTNDNSGELLLFQDGVLAARLDGLNADDSVVGQWFVGNLAAGLQPAASTIYVDDVTIRASP
jgi:hypothetical protein